MQPSRIVQQQHWVMPRHWIKRPTAPFLTRFLGKFVLDIMPAALASVIGGFLFTQYHSGHAAPRPVAEEGTPASAEMMALVRDEHAMIIDYLKTQMAAEKSRMAAEDAADAKAADSKSADTKIADTKIADAKTADAKTADAKTADAKTVDAKVALEASARRLAATARMAVPRAKPAAALTNVAMAAPMVAPMAAPPAHAPLVIAQADQTGDGTALPPDRLAKDPNSLLGKTLDLKDHVVAATRHVVFMIGDVFNAVGERIGGPAPGPRQFSWDS